MASPQWDFGPPYTKVEVPHEFLMYWVYVTPKPLLVQSTRHVRRWWFSPKKAVTHTTEHLVQKKLVARCITQGDAMKVAVRHRDLPGVETVEVIRRGNIHDVIYTFN